MKNNYAGNDELIYAKNYAGTIYQSLQIYLNIVVNLLK